MPFKRSKTKIARRPRIRQNGSTPLTYYRSGGSEGASSPFKKNTQGSLKKSTLFRRFTDTAVLLIVLAGLVYSLILKSEPEIKLSSSLYRPSLAYKHVVAKQLNSLKNQNKITVNDKEVTSRLLTDFPEIVSASVRIPLIGQTPRVEIVVASPSLFLKTADLTYIVNQDGKIIGKDSDFTQIKGLIVINDESNFKATVGEQVLSAQATSFVNVLAAQLVKSKVATPSLVLPPLANELRLRTGDNSYYTKFYLAGDPLQQVGQFIASRQHFISSDISPGEYLDVRVAGKVFYK